MRKLNQIKWQYIDNKKQTRLITSWANCALLPKQAQCATTANSSLLGSVGSLLPVHVALRDLGDNSFQWTFMTNRLSPTKAPDKYVWYL